MNRRSALLAHRCINSLFDDLDRMGTGRLSGPPRESHPALRRRRIARHRRAPLAERLSPALGKPVIIDNRPGRGRHDRRRSRRDAAARRLQPALHGEGRDGDRAARLSEREVQPAEGLQAVDEILQVPHIIVATNKAPYNDMKGLVEYAKKNPGKINYASNGIGLASARRHGDDRQPPRHQARARAVQGRAGAGRDRGRGRSLPRGLDDRDPEHQGRQDQGARHLGAGAHPGAAGPADAHGVPRRPRSRTASPAIPGTASSRPPARPMRSSRGSTPRSSRS